MKVCQSRALFAIVVLLLSCCCFAQTGPTPIYHALPEYQLGVSYLLSAKNPNYDLGNGGLIAVTHYISPNLGLNAEFEGMEMDRYNMTEYAFRAGPNLRFCVGRFVQPFVTTSVGISHVKANYLSGRKTVGLDNTGGAFSAGVGADVRVKRNWFLRLTADVADNWDSNIRLGRGTIGFSYHFGEITERK